MDKLAIELAALEIILRDYLGPQNYCKYCGQIHQEWFRFCEPMYGAFEAQVAILLDEEEKS